MVDDDAEDRSIIKDAMDVIDAAHETLFAENGEQALALLASDVCAGNLPCLIVLDLNMPKMNGTQTLRHLKQDTRFKNIPVIIYSTSINQLEQEKCMALGAHSYVTKPITFSESTQVANSFLQFCQQKSAVS